MHTSASAALSAQGYGQQFFFLYNMIAYDYDIIALVQLQVLHS